jgi:hypothetical protein
MGSFAETENVDYRLSFADQGKNKLLFSGSLPFPFTICSKQTEVAIFRIDILKRQHFNKYKHIYVPASSIVCYACASVQAK